MRAGQRLYGSLQVPGPGSPVPDLALLGPGIAPSGAVPSFVQVPTGSSAMVSEGELPGTPSYEPFTPQPIYEVARFNVTVPQDGDCYVAVYGSEGGRYSLAPGFQEEFTIDEWLLTPWSVVSIHLWEGQSPAFVFAPLVVVLAGGLTLFVLYRRRRGLWPDLPGWLLLIAGLLYIGGAAMTGLQVAHAVQRTGWESGVAITLMFIAGPVILGSYAISMGVRLPRAGAYVWRGAAMVLVGLLGLALWAGLLVGPVLAIAGGVLVVVQHFRRPSPA